MRTLLLLSSLILSLSLFGQSNCQTAPLVGYGIHAVDTISGQSIAGIECISNTAGTQGAWYAFFATQDTLITVSTDLAATNGSDTRINVFTGACNNLICLGGDDDGGSGATSVFSFDVVAGNFYFIVFDDRWDNDPFEFEISASAPPVTLITFSQQLLGRSGSLEGVVDMNGDYLDDVVSIQNDNVHVQYQNADGSFTEANLPTPSAGNSPSWSFTAGDLNGDGLNDLIYGGGSGVTFMFTDSENGGFEEFSPEPYIFCQRANCVDMNNDGLLDAFVCHDVEPNVYFINSNNEDYEYFQGGLGETPNGGNYGSIWIDYDNDGDQDLFIAKCRGGGSDAKINQMHRNNGDGTFTEVGAELGLADPLQTWSAAWGDFDNDGDMDVFVGASSFSDGRHKLLRNDLDTFVDITAGSGYENFNPTSIENTTHDYNNDGYLDIFGAGNIIMFNNGDMTFTRSEIPGTNGPNGDLNNDGFMDFVNSSGGQNRVYLNDGNDNNWLKILTQGTVSNWNGIGARVEVFTDQGKQIRDVRSGDGFGFMSSLNVHFGLGQSTTIEKVIVKWPSGIVDEIIAPDINTVLTVIEGGSPSSTEDFAAEKLEVYPNPVVNELFIPSDLSLEGASVRIFDQMGRVLINRELNEHRIDVNRLPAGAYQLVYRNAENTFLGKFIKR
jgi:hypothetical protein